MKYDVCKSCISIYNTKKSHTKLIAWLKIYEKTFTILQGEYNKILSYKRELYIFFLYLCYKSVQAIIN